MTRQVPLRLLAALPDPVPYPHFPRKPLDRARWARGVPFDNRAARQVLLLLALDANDASFAWTGTATLARQCGLSRAGVFEALAWLQGRGWLLVREGRRQTRERRPKAPCELLCRECFMPDHGAPMCPYCGADGLLQGVQSLDLPRPVTGPEEPIEEPISSGGKTL